MSAPLPTLFIVMGTSGSGKSTLGLSLSQALHLPFIDGDDLHPPENIAKMSRGEALNDTDREPWLKRIRQTAEDIFIHGKKVETAEESIQSQKDEEKEEQRKLAEVFESSAGEAARRGSSIDAQEIKEADPSPAQEVADQQPIDPSKQHRPHPIHPQTGNPPAIIIACSALKRSYRDLLRGNINSLPTSSTTPSSSKSTQSSSFQTIHLYVQVSPEELLRRMHARKGHFMKEEMLRSQLATLEQPTEEENGIILLQDGEKDDVEKRAEESVREVLRI